MHIDLQRLTNIKVAIAISDNLHNTAVSRRGCLRPLHIRSSPMSLPHVLKRIRLELARSKEFPMGSANHGYEFVAPLDGNGHIDPHLWQQYRQHSGRAGFGTAPAKKSGN